MSYLLITGPSGTVHANMDCETLPGYDDPVDGWTLPAAYEVEVTDDPTRVRDLGVAACRICAWEPAAGLALSSQDGQRRGTFVIFKRSKPEDARPARRRAEGPDRERLRDGAVAALTRLGAAHDLSLYDGEGAPVLYGFVTAAAAGELEELCATAVLPAQEAMPGPETVRAFLAVKKITGGRAADLWAAACELSPPRMVAG